MPCQKSGLNFPLQLITKNQIHECLYKANSKAIKNKVGIYFTGELQMKHFLNTQNAYRLLRFTKYRLLISCPPPHP